MASAELSVAHPHAAPPAPAYASTSPFSAPPTGPATPLQRPGWVLMVAIFQFIGAGFAILVGLLVATVGGFVAEAIAEEANEPEFAELAGGVLAVIGILIVLWGAFQIVLGTQNLKGRQWARMVTLVFSFLSALGTLASLVVGNVFGLFSLVFDVLIIVGLLLPETANWFRQESERRGRMAAST